MDEQTGTPPASGGGGRQSEAKSSEETSARGVLLAEARTAANQQLSQLTKIDDAAVRTVRITFVLAGIFVGGPSVSSFPNLGVFGALGTWALVTSLFCSLYVYGTSHLFIGAGPAELNVDYEEPPNTEKARVEVIRKYESGIHHNWSALYVNGFALAASRLLLALAVLFLVVGIARVI